MARSAVSLARAGASVVDMQTAAVIAAIIATVGFFWLNVPSKDDIKLLREDMNRQFAEVNAEMDRRFSELRSDIQRLD